jgi:hypothetical protein
MMLLWCQLKIKHGSHGHKGSLLINTLKILLELLSLLIQNIVGMIHARFCRLQIWLNPNCAIIVIGWSLQKCTFLVVLKSKMAALTGLSFWHGKMIKSFFQKLQTWLKPISPWIIISWVTQAQVSLYYKFDIKSLRKLTN